MSVMTTPARFRAGPQAVWDLVVPVKGPDTAKSRLADALSPADRRSLVVEMFSTTLRACLLAPTTRSVTVVTPDADMAARAEQFGAGVVIDPPPTWLTPDGVADDPHNRALAHALPPAVASPVGVVTADLPLLTAEVLTRVCEAAAAHRQSIVADHHGTGTTMAFWTRPTGAAPRRPQPRFGPRSAARFVDDGAVPLAAAGAGHSPETGHTPETDPWLCARLEIDTADDLRALPERLPERHPTARSHG